MSRIHHKHHDSHKKHHEHRHNISHRNIDEDVLKVAEEEERKLASDSHKPKRRVVLFGREIHPGAIILGLVLALLIVMMVVPQYGVKLDPEPKNIPGVYIIPDNVEELAQGIEHLPTEMRGNYRRMMMPGHPEIKRMAARIATESCPGVKVCYAKAIFYFVRDNFVYVSDPPKGYLESPFEVMMTGGSDCDGMTILLANLLQGVGMNTRLVFVPGHVYVQIKIDEAKGKYKEKDGWITMDPTCKGCDFGEVPLQSWNSEKKDYLYV